MKRRLRVIETFHNYQLVDTVVERSAGMGDGVGMRFGTIGTEEFRQEWEDWVNDDFAHFFKMYFSDLYHLVIYDNPGYMDRYTVILSAASGGFHNALGLSDHPDSPLGLSQMGVVDTDYLEEMDICTTFLDLPQNVQKHIARRLEDE